MRKAEVSILAVIVLGLLITLLAEVSYGETANVDSNTTEKVSE